IREASALGDRALARVLRVHRVQRDGGFRTRADSLGWNRPVFRFGAAAHLAGVAASSSDPGGRRKRVNFGSFRRNRANRAAFARWQALRKPRKSAKPRSFPRRWSFAPGEADINSHITWSARFTAAPPVPFEQPEIEQRLLRGEGNQVQSAGHGGPAEG